MDLMQRLFVPELLGGRAAVGLLVVRVVVGLAFVLHGYPKIQHPGSWMTVALGPHAFAPPWLQALSAIAEFCGGIGLMLGALTPLASLLLAGDMLVALLKVELPSGATFVGQHAYELTATFLAVAVGVFFTGPGSLSVDLLLANARREAQRNRVRPRHWR